MNILDADPVSGLVLSAAISSASAAPAGSTYAGIFAIGAQLQINGGSAAGLYSQSGTVAIPAWTKNVVGATGATGATGPTGPTGPTGV